MMMMFQRCSRLTARQISLAAWHRKPKRIRRSTRAERRRRAIKESASGSLPMKRSSATTKGIDEFSLKRFLNPWIDLAEVIPHEEALQERVESTARTFGIVAALIGSVAAGLLTFTPHDGYDTTTTRQPARRGDDNGMTNYMQQEETKQQLLQSERQQQPFSPLPLQRRNTLNFIEHVTFTQHVSGTSLLVSWGIPKSELDDIYTACCAGSFYTGVLTTVLSSIITAWLSATPPGGVRSFVRLYSWPIVMMPGLLCCSTSLAGVALFIALDMEHGTPVSLIGLGGTVVGGATLGLISTRGWIHTYKALTDAVIKKRVL